jgi:predicted TIM-barrel fold metal-dependent hydrolase
VVPVRRIVDAHHHFVDFGANYYPWLSDKKEPAFFLGDYSAICSDFTPADYAAATAGYDIAGSVHIEAEADRSAQVEETRWLTEVARQGLPNAIIGHVWLANANCEAILARHAQYPLVRGVRSKPLTAASVDDNVRGMAGSLQDPAWLAGYEMLGEFGFSYDLRVPYWHLIEAAEVAARFPSIPVAVNHTGLPLDRSDEGLARWRHAMGIIAQCPNVHLKIAELGHRELGWDEQGNRRIVREAVEIFGADRCMFGSNLPVSSLSAPFGTIVETVHAAIADLPEDQIDAVFATNAVAFYRMELPLY